MKLSPLKNKMHEYTQDESFLKIDVVSAVEWLKKTLSKGIMNYDGDTVIDADSVFDCIDEAFEDVINNEK